MDQQLPRYRQLSRATCEPRDLAQAQDLLSVDVFYRALIYANFGMDLVVVTPNVSTPYSIRTKLGNFPH